MDTEEEPPIQTKNSLSRKFQYLSSAVAAIGSFGLGNVTAWTSPTLTQIGKDFEASGDELTWIASLFPVGAIFSGIFSGWLIEKFGRKKSMHLLCIPFIIGWILISFAQNLTMLYIGRFVSGVCAGAQILIMPIYVSETVDENIRGICTGFFAIFAASGIFLTFVIGTVVSWQVLSILCAIVPGIGFLGLYFIPETPAYLLKKGHIATARESLVWLRGMNATAEEIDRELAKMQSQLDETSPTAGASIRDFIVPEVLKPFTIVMIIMVIQQFSGVNCIVFYASQIFDSAKALNSDVSSIVIAGVNLTSCVICMQFLDKAGRKVMFIISSIGSASALIGLGVYFYIQATSTGLKNESGGYDAVENLNWLPLASLVVFNIFFTAGLGPVPFIYMAEVLPSRIIGRASGICITFNWILAFTITKSFEGMKSGLGDYGCFWLFGGSCLVGTVFIMFVPETKGKSLHEIQTYFS